MATKTQNRKPEAENVNTLEYLKEEEAKARKAITFAVKQYMTAVLNGDGVDIEETRHDMEQAIQNHAGFKAELKAAKKTSNPDCVWCHEKPQRVEMFCSQKCAAEYGIARYKDTIADESAE